LSLPGTAFILVVAGQKRRRLQKTLLLQMIKNSQVEGKPTNLLQVIVMLPTADQFEAKHGLTWPAWVVSSRIAILRTIRL
jgi:hypothetical protein